MSETALDPLYGEALALYDRGELAAAATLFERVLEASPNHVEARYKLGNARKELGALDLAVAQYRRLLRLDPTHAEALNNLGAVFQFWGLATNAENCYRKAMQLKPGLAQPYVNLGRMLQECGRERDAQNVFEQALRQGLDRGLFGHLHDAASGASSARAPQAYVRETFDAFAAEFDARLESLAYRVPQRLAAMARIHLAGAGLEAADTLDLGCGTGLVGDALGKLGGPLVGVDLSQKMLDIARRKGRYRRLIEADIVSWLQPPPSEDFDLVVAADVFIYLGELDQIFAGVRRRLRPGRVFAFSVESCPDADYVLQPSGRYAHSAAYIARLAAANGFAVTVCEEIDVRTGTRGKAYLLQRDRAM